MNTKATTKDTKNTWSFQQGFFACFVMVTS